jgi:hypothetical protein
MLQGPFIVLFEQQSANEPGDGAFVGEDADDIGAPLDRKRLLEPTYRAVC